MKSLYSHISKFVDVSEEEFKELTSYFKEIELKKKELIYTAGSNDLQHYFVIDGCLHMYLVNERGSEQTLQFAIEDWWITDYLAFQQHRQSEFYIQAVKNSRIIAISAADQEKLLQDFPKMETYFRHIYQTAYGAAINRMKYIFTCSKEEIYFKFKEAFPDFVNDVPQYLVATYLGLSPEYVSKLNKKQLS